MAFGRGDTWVAANPVSPSTVLGWLATSHLFAPWAAGLARRVRPQRADGQ